MKLEPPKVVTFDCAGTLLEVDWRPGHFASQCAQAAGVQLGSGASSRYDAMLADSRGRYLELNLTRDHALCKEYWGGLLRDWLGEMEADLRLAPEIERISRETGFGPSSDLFKVYDDVLPCLEELRGRGVRLAVISNWDYSLHSILQMKGLASYFEVVIASLEEGFEKPDKRIFDKALLAMGVKSSEAAHVGDDPIDDLRGAKEAGMRAILVDRKRLGEPTPPYVSSLSQLAGALGWTD